MVYGDKHNYMHYGWQIGVIRKDPRFGCAYCAHSISTLFVRTYSTLIGPGHDEWQNQIQHTHTYTVLPLP